MKIINDNLKIISLSSLDESMEQYFQINAHRYRLYKILVLMPGSSLQAQYHQFLIPILLIFFESL
ncbi:MAG TPA: hypothetical protein VE843_08070, partial [Ktedonobacteraceae bacterium]|nr:hypothetical protein [Ktedonobacteraceae bacterium]